MGAGLGIGGTTWGYIKYTGSAKPTQFHGQDLQQVL